MKMNLRSKSERYVQDYGETDAEAEMDSRRRHSSLAGSVAALNQQAYDEANMVSVV